MLCVNISNARSEQRINQMKSVVFPSFLFNTVPFLSIDRLSGKHKVTDKHKKHKKMDKKIFLKTGKVLH